MNHKILIVDDSVTALLMEQTLFAKYPQYDLVMARDGVEAIKQALEEQPDLILMDVIMPNMDGFNACREMRKIERLRRTPIILVTSRGEAGNVEEGFASGCSDYLTKPIVESELLKVVNSYLSHENPGATE